MTRREVREILAAHADGSDDPYSRGKKGSIRSEQIQGLLDLAEELQGVLVPVAPDVHYRRRLHGELILQAQEREAGSAPSVLRQHGKGILIGAAAVGSVASVTGVVIAFLLRARNGGAANIATG